MQKIGESAWICGDPGMQYDTTINKWHTCKNTDKIYGSNPCSEYMFLNDSACNLASLNLMKFRHADGEFDVEAFKHASRILITAQEIIVDNASYPTPRIGENSAITVRLDWATRTSAPCSWRGVWPMTATRAALTPER